ncbi:MAG: cobalamin biosynthesis protein CobD, partial [Rhizobiales bacterium]|nr:cobalamin biosynthesis protein CobD [Hyphomicrobiales bacterium]
MIWPLPAFGVAALTLGIERMVGYPNSVHAAIGHPVEWMGRLIDWLDLKLNWPGTGESEGRARGAVALALLLIAVFIPAWLVARMLHGLPLGFLIEPVLATAFIAQRSLKEHVAAVAAGLRTSLEDGRSAVSHIVGRDPNGLDGHGVARAALESLAENSSDGIVAPVLWYGLLGFPGIVLYKAINTADSMIGHRTERYLHFGWAAARLDDLVNLPASRLTGLLFAAASGRFGEVVAVTRRDGPLHQSPNAGWPEAALAASVGRRLGGPRSYGGKTLDLAWMGDGRSD